MQIKSHEQTDTERITDLVYAAMETGNPARAREVLAEHEDSFPAACDYARTSAMREYGIRL